MIAAESPWQAYRLNVRVQAFVGGARATRVSLLTSEEGFALRFAGPVTVDQSRTARL